MAESDNPTEDGGQGVLTDPHHLRADCIMLARAIRNEWPVNAKLRQDVLARLEMVVENLEDDRNAIAAAKVILGADAVNARREATILSAMKPAPGPATVNVNIQQNNVRIDDPAQLEKLSMDELLRLHKETLALPEQGAEQDGAAR